MSWHYNEIVRSGNVSARVKNYYPDIGLLVLIDIQGELSAGMTIVGDESGTSLTLSSFTIAEDYDMNYAPDYWDDLLENVIYDGDGRMIALDPHFTGNLNQDSQPTYYLVA